MLDRRRPIDALRSKSQFDCAFECGEIELVFDQSAFFAEWNARRLDKDSEGLLVLTNDGPFVETLLSHHLC